MKILVIIDTLGVGGAERVLVNTLPELKRIGINCEVAILFNRDDLAHELENQGIKVHKINLSYKWNIIEGIYKLNKLIKKNHYDIVHAHLFFSYFYTGLVKGLLNKDIKTITTFHNLAYLAYPANTFLKKIRKKMDSFIVNNFIDYHVAVSKAVKEHYMYHLNISDIDIIPNGFYLKKILFFNKRFDKDYLTEFFKNKKCRKFSITPGRLVKEKGHKYLLNALKKVEDLDLCHFIIGSGPLKNEINTMIKKLNLNNVMLIDGLIQDELFKFVNSVDFVIIPSISEGFSLVIGESMALGKAIIATNIGGISDLIKHERNGLLVEPGDVKSLAITIEKLYNSPILCNNLGRYAKNDIKNFDIEKISLKWKDYYKKVLNG